MRLQLSLCLNIIYFIDFKRVTQELCGAHWGSC